MPEPTFAQAERRSFVVPILIALVAIAAAAAIAMHFFPATTVNIEHVHTEVLPTETVFKGSTIIGLSEKTRILYVASTIRIDNQLRIPIYLDGFNLTLTNPQDAELTAQAVAKSELPTLFANFPALKPMMASPLLRDTAIDPGKFAQGTVLYSLTLPKETWDTRKSAVIKVALYHQPAVYVTIPR